MTFIMPIVLQSGHLDTATRGEDTHQQLPEGRSCTQSDTVAPSAERL